MTALNVVAVGKEELQKERESLLEVKKIVEEQLAVLKAEELTLRGVLQTQTSLNSSELAVASAESQGAEKGNVVPEIDNSLQLDHSNIASSGSTELPELYLAVSTQHSETLEVQTADEENEDDDV